MSVPLHRFLRPVVTAGLDERVGDVARTMRERRVGCVVVTRDRHPVGIVTDRDLALRVLAEGRDPNRTTIADIVTYDPIVVHTNDGIELVAEVMRTHGVRRLPIVDAIGVLAGVVTADDLTMLLGRELSSIAQSIEGASDTTESR